MFENKLDYWMDKKGLKNKYVANLCGVSETTFSKWRKNKTQPDLEKVDLLIEVLSITADELMYGENKK